MNVELILRQSGENPFMDSTGYVTARILRNGCFVDPPGSLATFKLNSEKHLALRKHLITFGFAIEKETITPPI